MNKFTGKITNITKHEILHILEINVNHLNLKVFTLQLNDSFQVHTDVELMFKETAPILVKGEAPVSAANRIPATVTDIRRGKIFAEIKLESVAGYFTSLLTMDVLRKFDLKKYDVLAVYLKASDISIGKNDDE